MARDLCNSHYAQWYRGEDLKDIGPTARTNQVVKVEPGSDRACIFPNCARVKHSNGLCGAHNAQQRAGIALRPVRELKECRFDGCERDAWARGLCQAHDRQLKKGSDLRPIRTERTHRTRTVQGYAKVYDPGHPNAQGRGWILEHVKVMSEILGRPLFKDENVHHINGVKDDNRPENLELWSTSQPKGQRVEDKVAWAKMILERYRM